MSRPAISYPIPNADPDDAISALAQPQPPPPPPSAGQNVHRDAPTGRSHTGPRGPTSTLDSYITRLLVVTKQLLQGLDQWSQGLLTEEDVSDVYVRLGNGFELCVSTFRRAGISTSDLDSIPNDLREILERALAEEPSQDTLNIYLPDIRAIIFNLLNGLKIKQMAYKRHITERQQQGQEHVPLGGRSSPAPNYPPVRQQVSPAMQMADSETRSIRSMTSDGATSPVSTSSGMGATRQPPPANALAERERSQSRSAARPPPPDAFRPTRSRPAQEAGSRSGAQPTSPEARYASPSSITSALPGTSGPQSAAAVSGPSRPHPRRPERASRDGVNNVTSRFSADSDLSAASSGRPGSDPMGMTPMPVPRPGSALGQTSGNVLGQPQTTSATNVQPSSSLTRSVSPQPGANAPPAPPSSQPQSLPTLKLPEPPAPSASDVTDEVHPAARSSFALLQKQDALERRASKRYSSYTFRTLPGASPGAKKGTSSNTGSPTRPARRSMAVPQPMPALPPLTEDNPARQRQPSEGESDRTVKRYSLVDAPVPQLLFSDGDSPVDGGESAGTSATALGAPSAMRHAQHAKPLTVFLQLGRQVKKTTVELPLDMSALRLLFMERFEYDPGMEDFPEVYIQDPKTGVQYELEDMEDVQDGCKLTLDIEPLDQVKQHIDIAFATLSQEMKEVKTALAQAKRQSTTITPSLLAVSSPSVTAAPAPPTPEQQQPPTPAAGPRLQTLRTASGSSIAPAAELQAHYDEVQSLRRDLAIIRQLHVDFLQQTKESFTALRQQNSAMREVVKTKMGGNRALLDNSKAKLEGQCQDTIQAVEEVSDIIDGAREDALRRGITPARGNMEKIRADLKHAAELVETFAADVTLADPTWRATWLSELQRVTEEQRLLAYQNKLAADLKNDIKDATEMLGNVQAFVDQRVAAGGASGRRFQPPPPEEGAGGIGNLLLEIRTKESDPNQRLKAIEERQRARERDLASRTDEFQDELSGFVSGKKLRKTGGTDEAERVRQRRQDQTIRRMLSGDGPGSPPGVLSPQGTGQGKQRTSSQSQNADIPDL